MPFWRAIAVFRVASLAYVVVLVLRNMGDYAHPVAAWAVLAVMAAWTALTGYAYLRARWRRWPLLLADLLVAVGVLLLSDPIVGRPALDVGTPTLAVAWLGAPVLAWAVAGGRRRGVAAALLLGGTDLVVRGHNDQSGVTGATLMLLAGVTVGHVARLAEVAERRLHRAVEMEAATRERERLARDIHDSVLQVLALVQRRGVDLDGEAGELARLAGEQEAALRALVTAAKPSGDNRARTDLMAVLTAHASATVSIAGPAGPVLLPARAAGQLAAAVAAALDNVARHGGPSVRAWVLVEEEPDAVTVTVRDDGPGIGEGRLVEAAREGRLGIAQSIRGRIEDLGGAVVITSAPGHGTEVELTVAREPIS
ncbi:MAG TPA: DUF5931 domain-containing protein [Catenuloplanes sp.]